MSSVEAVPRLTLRGVSGQLYRAGVHLWAPRWNEVAGVYVVLRDDGSRYAVLYVGKTNNLQERLASHHRQPCFDRHRRTHLAWLPEANSIKRAVIERDLMDFYKPTCNQEV